MVATVGVTVADTGAATGEVTVAATVADTVGMVEVTVIKALAATTLSASVTVMAVAGE